MQCPPAIAEIVTQILATGLLRIRVSGWRGNAKRCAIEADHLHNLPALLTAYRPELLDYYWRTERVAFIRQCSPEEAAAFEPLWTALNDLIEAGKTETIISR
jgi:hypothetical protein